MKDRKKSLLTIRMEVFLLSFAILAVISLVFLYVFFQIFYWQNMDGARASLRECNSQIVTYLEGMFHENDLIISLLSKNDAVIHEGYGNPESVLRIYDAIQEDTTKLTYIYSGYEDGSLYIRDYAIPEGYRATDRPWYREACAEDGNVKLFYADAASGEWLFSQCRKLVDSDGKQTGVISIDCSNESITSQLSARYRYKSQRSYILDSAGEVLIHPDVDYIGDTLINYVDESIWARIVSGSGNYEEYRVNGERAMAYFERIPDTEFFVATTIDMIEVTEPIFYNMMYLLGLLVVISIILGFVLGFVLMYRFARPVLVLKSRIESVAYGGTEEAQELRFANEEINDIAVGIETIVKDISRREEQRKAAEYLSFHDTMTGLYNRRFFEEEVRRLDTARNYPLCIICCDINGLKLINDVFGHDVGDKLICKIADRLAGECRADDILARMGGDEFAIIMPRTSAQTAQRIIARIKSGFPRENICGAEISASLGFGIKERKEETYEEIVRRADKMMYGRKLVESAEMKRQTVSNMIEAAVKEGLVKPLTEQEGSALDGMASAFCPESRFLLRQAYWLRKIGLCSLFQSGDPEEAGVNRRHTEYAYRLLSVIEEYRGIAGYVLHYTEHWDGSGWPSGLSGRDIPLIARILAVADACLGADGEDGKAVYQNCWLDPEILSLCSKLLSE